LEYLIRIGQFVMHDGGVLDHFIEGPRSEAEGLVCLDRRQRAAATTFA